MIILSCACLLAYLLICLFAYLFICLFVYLQTTLLIQLLPSAAVLVCLPLPNAVTSTAQSGRSAASMGRILLTQPVVFGQWNCHIGHCSAAVSEPCLQLSSSNILQCHIRKSESQKAIIHGSAKTARRLLNIFYR